MNGSFSEQSLSKYQNLLQDKLNSFGELVEGEVYDFARCVRPDGTFYGTRGRCIPPNKPVLSKEEKDKMKKAPVKEKDVTLKGISADSFKVLDSMVKGRNRQQNFMKDVVSEG